MVQNVDGTRQKTKFLFRKIKANIPNVPVWSVGFFYWYNMSKDPAVLFYTSDFLTGTEFFSFEEKGKYIHLLCTQHQNGHLPKDYMIKIIGNESSQIWKKFNIDAEGFYFNERMQDETKRRKNFAESRRKNISKRYEATSVDTYEATSVDTYEATSVEIMKPHMETVTETITDNNLLKNSRFDKKLILKYFSDKSYSIEEAELFYNHYASQGWVSGNGLPITNWKLKAENWHKEQSKRTYDNNQKPKSKFEQPTARPADWLMNKNNLCDCGCGQKFINRKDGYKIATEKCYIELTKHLVK